MKKLHRKSRQRTRLLQILENSHEHPTADRLYEALKQEFPRLSLGTVYRNLSVLVEMGKVRKIHFGSSHDRFEATGSPHLHLVCEHCGKIEDDPWRFDPLLLRDIEQVHAFQVRRQRIDLVGLCKACRKNLTGDHGDDGPAYA